MYAENEMHWELAKANKMDHGGVIICFDDYEVSYRDARCVFCTRVVSFITRKKQELYPLLTSIIDLYLGLKGV
jgi:hypothetical protein